MRRVEGCKIIRVRNMLDIVTDFLLVSRGHTVLNFFEITYQPHELGQKSLAFSQSFMFAQKWTKISAFMLMGCFHLYLDELLSVR